MVVCSAYFWVKGHVRAQELTIAYSLFFFVFFYSCVRGGFGVEWDGRRSGQYYKGRAWRCVIGNLLTLKVSCVSTACHVLTLHFYHVALRGKNI